MSLQATAWALKVAKVGDPIAKLILLGLADHAADDGTAAWPSHAKLAEYAEVSTRTVIRKVQELLDRGLIRPGDQDLVSHFPANRRPRVWDLRMSWDDVLSPRQSVRGDNLSPQAQVRGDTVLSPQEVVRGDTPDHLGVTAVSHKPSLEPSLTEDSLRSSSVAREPRASRLDPDWIPSPELIEQMRGERPDLDLKAEHLKFVDYWRAKPGKDGRKLDWPATWRNWMRNARASANGQNRYVLKRQEETDTFFEQMLTHARETDRARAMQDQPKEINP